MTNLPSGTVAFLFTDIEGSTRLAQEFPDKWEDARARHHAILREAIESHNGYVFHIIGDAFCAAFHTAGDALHAAVKSQTDLHHEDWGDTPIKVRMGINTGTAQVSEDIDNPGGYRGYTSMARVQRLMSAAHGGQTLISLATEELVRDDLPDTITLRDMGERRLKDLIFPEHIYQLVIPNLPVDFPPLKTLDAYRHNLPIQMTSFIGREKEIAEIAQAIREHRLLTLTGIGGTGKTRLSLQVAADLLESFSEGVWFIELASLSNPDLIPSTILSTLGISEQQGRPALKVLEEYLAPKKLLIVLDSCEHLIADAAKVTNAILNAAPDLKILASSREILGVKGELLWHVPSLSLPDPKNISDLKGLTQCEAVRLFVDRASLVDSHFTLTTDNAPAIAQICFRLEGIPLAIELAAARVRMLSLDQISARLDDRFRLLTGGARTTLPRQQTLRSTIDWSYDLLSETERLLLRRLAVFSGGWTLELAEQVCSDEKLDQSEILDTLSKLVDKSLVTVVQEKTGTRYRMLETIYQYAREKLAETGEAPAIRDQHLRCFLSLAEKSEPNLFGREAAAWFARLDKELDNIRAAMEWSTNSGKADLALRIAGSIVFFWLSYGLAGSEWQNRVQQALSRPEGKERTLARAKALNGVGFMYWTEIFPTDKRQELEEALSIGREFGDQRIIATALRNLGLLENIKGNYLEARSLLEQSLVIWREMGSEGKTESASTLIFLGDVAFNHNEAKWARSLYEEAVAIFREIGDITFLAYVVRRLGQLLWHEGNYEAAIVLCKESLDSNLAKGDPRGIMACLAGFAAIAAAEGKFERAARLMATVETQLLTIGIQLLSLDKKEYERNLTLLRAQLNEIVLNKLWSEGAAMSTEEAIKYALEDRS